MKMEEDAFFLPIHLDNELRNDHNIPGFCGDKAPIIAIRSTSFTPTTTSPAQWRHCLEGIKFEEDTFILTGFIRDESQIQIRKSFIWQPIRRWPAPPVNRNVVQG